MIKFFVLISILLSALFSSADSAASEKFSDWKKHKDPVFSNAEANFKAAMKELLEQFVDQNISEADLYRAATAGMLDSLNPGANTWNKLLTPQEFRDLKNEVSGEIVGIGITIKFNEETGHGQILKVLPKSPALASGLRSDDQILSVNGKTFKGKTFQDLVFAIRGKRGENVSLAVLREDHIVNFKVKREPVKWTPVELESMDSTTKLLTIGYFTKDVVKLVEEKIAEINKSGCKKLLIDVRENGGGGFDEAVAVTELFIPKNSIVAQTRNRLGELEKFSSKSGILNDNISIIILTNRATSSGAELFAGALKESRRARIVGESTFGKWNAQTIKVLPNDFVLKYTSLEFQTPNGKSYGETGIKPDIEVTLPKNIDIKELMVKSEAKKRAETDLQLKAALEL